MKTKTISLLTKMVCFAAMLSAVACTATMSKEEPTATKTKSASTTAAPADGEDEGAADKVVCAVSADCDSDERCQDGRCIGLDGDRD